MHNVQNLLTKWAFYMSSFPILRIVLYFLFFWQVILAKSDYPFNIHKVYFVDFFISELLGHVLWKSTINLHMHDLDLV